MKRLFRKLLKGVKYVPRVMVTDQLGSYGTAKREKLPGVEHRQRRYLNNRVRHEVHERNERNLPRVYRHPMSRWGSADWTLRSREQHAPERSW